MPLVKATLQTALETLFSSMGDNATNKDFADGIANAVVAFVSTGTVSTTDAGTVTGGVFAGSGTGTITVTANDCSKIIQDACSYMLNKTDDKTFDGEAYLATELGKAFKKMSDDATVITTVTGTLTTPSGATSVFAGSAKGSISCNSTALEKNIKDVFSQMWSNREVEGYNGNKKLAEKIASEVDSFWKSGIISTNGQGNLVGTTGTGSVS